MTTDVRPDLNLSLQELEGSDWGDPETTDTWMVKQIHAIRRKPVDSLSNEDLRLAVSQRVGEPYTVLLAIERLAQDPLMDADYYPGDMLSALIRKTSQTVWENDPVLRGQLNAICALALARPADEAQAFRESLGLPLDGKPN